MSVPIASGRSRNRSDEWGATVRYEESPPDKRLAGLAVCEWKQTFTGKGPWSHKIFPDGCVDVVWIGDRPPIVVGPNTQACVVQFDSSTEILGVRLTPGAAGAVFRERISVLLDIEVPLSDVWRGFPWQKTDSPEADRASWIEALRRSEPRPEPRILDAVGRVFGSSDSVETLASRYGLSSRQFLRLFVDHVGYGPKFLSRVVRLQRTIAMAQDPLALADVAFAAGYSDQSHMNREFQALVSERPTAFWGVRGSSLVLSDLFKTALPRRL